MNEYRVTTSNGKTEWVDATHFTYVSNFTGITFLVEKPGEDASEIVACFVAPISVIKTKKPRASLDE